MGAITLQMAKDLLSELERTKEGTTDSDWDSALIQEEDGSEYQAVLALGVKDGRPEEFVLAMPDPDSDDAFYNPRDFDFIAWCHNAPLEKALRLLIQRVQILEDGLREVGRVIDLGPQTIVPAHWRKTRDTITAILNQPLEVW